MSKITANRQRKQLTKNTQKNTSLILIIGVVLGVVLLGIGIWAANPATPTPSQAAVMEDAKVIYESTCATCHGKEGQGHVQFNAPALTGAEHAWHHSDAQIIGIIRNGGEKMPPIGASFDNKKVKLILTYIKQWWTTQQKMSQQGTIGE